MHAAATQSLGRDPRTLTSVRISTVGSYSMFYQNTSHQFLLHCLSEPFPHRRAGRGEGQGLGTKTLGPRPGMKLNQARCLKTCAS